MDVEVTAHIGAAHGERAPDRRLTQIQDAIEWASKRHAGLQKERENLVKLAADNERVQLLGNATFHPVAEVDRLVKRYGKDLKETTAMANQAIVSATDFAATFKDNPARSLISLSVGMVLGLLLAGVVGLDIFAAINETSAADGALRRRGRSSRLVRRGDRSYCKHGSLPHQRASAFSKAGSGLLPCT